MFKELNKYLTRCENEPDSHYIIRICSNRKNLGLSWEQVTAVLNEELGECRTANAYRKYYAYHCENAVMDNTEPVTEYSELLELKKERVKLADERNQNRAYIRKLAREETIKEIAHEIVDKMTVKRLLGNRKVIDTYPKREFEAILQLSDWHYGMQVHNFWNEYNPEIAKVRIMHLLDSTIQHIREWGVRKIHVANLSDLIAGRIHSQIRIESRYDVITQIIHVSEMLAEFLTELSMYCEIEYYATSDNHSRLEPNKKESLDLESLTRITHWFLKARLKDNNSIHIHDNQFGEDIITFTTLGHKVAGVHGDKDKPSTVIDNISMMTEQHYDLIITAHLHHFSCDEKNRCDVVSNGSLMGTDTFAQSLRLSSKPSQNLIIVSESNALHAIHRLLV